MSNALKKVLSELDGLGSKAMQVRILGLKAKGAPGEAPGADAAGMESIQLADGAQPEVEPDGDELSPEDMAKLKQLLASLK